MTTLQLHEGLVDALTILQQSALEMYKRNDPMRVKIYSAQRYLEAQDKALFEE